MASWTDFPLDEVRAARERILESTREQPIDNERLRDRIKRFVNFSRGAVGSRPGEPERGNVTEQLREVVLNLAARLLATVDSSAATVPIEETKSLVERIVGTLDQFRTSQSGPAT